MTVTSRTDLSFADLPGWASADHAAALSVFMRSLDQTDLAQTPIADAAGQATDARGFFETWFTPVLIRDGQEGLLTGYYEPEFPASLTPNDAHRYPLYAMPPEGSPLPTRREIEEGGALDGHGVEIAWLADPVDAFFLHVQGSGRLRLPDGATLRVGFAGRNGHPYRSIGTRLIELGHATPDTISPETIRAWIRAHRDEGRELMWHNPSYIFFRILDGVPTNDGPLGTLGVSVTAGLTLAVDPDHIPLGLPVWVERPDHSALLVAQDTGSAIKGPQRADLFAGTGPDAGLAAGQIKDPVRLITLVPRQDR